MPMTSARTPPPTAAAIMIMVLEDEPDEDEGAGVPPLLEDGWHWDAAGSDTKPTSHCVHWLGPGSALKVLAAQGLHAPLVSGR